MKLVKISDENHARLGKIKGLLMSVNGKAHSFNDVIEVLLNFYEKSAAPA